MLRKVPIWVPVSHLSVTWALLIQSVVMQSDRVTRRMALRAAVAGATAVAMSGWRVADARRKAFPIDDGLGERFPALRLRVASPLSEMRQEIDFKSMFGAVGDGAADDAPAFQALAAAVNSGAVAAGTVVLIAPGRYRIVGNDPVRFNQPVVLRGAGPGQTVLQPEYGSHGGTCLWASGRGMYQTHSTGLYNGRQETNRYPNGPFVPINGAPSRGATLLSTDQAGVLAAGDEVYLLCDDYGETVTYTPTNTRAQHYLLKQHLRVVAAEGGEIALDQPLRHDFAGATPRLYRWQPLRGFGLEHLSFEERNAIPDSEASNTFRTVRLDGTVESWVWNVHFHNSTSMPLAIMRSRFAVVRECLFDRAQHLGGGGNGYLPEIYQTDDSLVEHCTSIDGRHALICNWTCWGNVFRYNRLIGTPNTETHGEYSVENLYLRNDARASRMEIGGGGDTVHAHDGPFNELRENHARIIRVLRPHDRENRIIGNWHAEPTLNRGQGTVLDGNVQVPPGWDDYPFARLCGHDHTATPETE